MAVMSFTQAAAASAIIATPGPRAPPLPSVPAGATRAR